MPEIKIHNVETNEIISREMTEEEKSIHDQTIVENNSSKEAEATKATEKAALLAKLGITEDEAKLLLS